VRVRFARSAEADLAAIGDWIAEDNLGRAASFMQELRERCLSLADRPRRFPIARRIGALEFRKLTHKGYLVFYLVLADRVEIVHVLHGARDWAFLDRRRMRAGSPQKMSPNVNEAYRRFSFPLYFCFTHRREMSPVALGRGRALWPTGNPPVP